MDLYDEFGNYTGPSLDDEEDFDEDEEHSNYAPDDYEDNNGALVEGTIYYTIAYCIRNNIYLSHNLYFKMQLKVTWILMIKMYPRIGKREKIYNSNFRNVFDIFVAFKYRAA